MVLGKSKYSPKVPRRLVLHVGLSWLLWPCKCRPALGGQAQGHVSPKILNRLHCDVTPLGWPPQDLLLLLMSGDRELLLNKLTHLGNVTGWYSGETMRGYCPGREHQSTWEKSPQCHMFLPLPGLGQCSYIKISFPTQIDWRGYSQSLIILWVFSVIDLKV